MKLHAATVTVRTPGRGFVDATREVREVVRASGVVEGLCHVFIQHTSASLLVQENADPRVQLDLAAWMEALAPEAPGRYAHDDEGDDDMPAHLRATVTRTSETLPVRDGDLALGTWQALYVWEHRRRAHVRTLLVTVTGR